MDAWVKWLIAVLQYNSCLPFLAQPVWSPEFPHCSAPDSIFCFPAVHILLKGRKEWQQVEEGPQVYFKTDLRRQLGWEACRPVKIQNIPVLAKIGDEWYHCVSNARALQGMKCYWRTCLLRDICLIKSPERICVQPLPHYVCAFWECTVCEDIR